MNYNPRLTAETQKSWRNYNKKIDFPKISGFREAGMNYNPRLTAETQKSWRNYNKK